MRIIYQKGVLIIAGCTGCAFIGGCIQNKVIDVVYHGFLDLMNMNLGSLAFP